MEHRLLDLLVFYGPPLLFAAQMFGIFGLPIPDEFLLTVAGALVRSGRLPGPPTALAAVGGCICGITLSYVLGRTVGLAALRRVVHVSDAALDRGHRWFARFGRWLLMFGYFIPGVRHVTAIAAGSTPLEYPVFARFAYTGAVLWSFTFLTLGYTAGQQWRWALATARHWWPLALVAIALAGASMLLSDRRARA